MHILALSTRVLRDPHALVNDADTALASTAPALLAISAAGAALFGIAVGSYHDPLQAAYAALKLPVLLIIPPLVTLPVLHAVATACGAPVGYRRLAMACLAGMARTGIIAAASAPMLWLPYSIGLEYHLAVIAFSAALTFAGLPGLTVIARAIPESAQFRFLAGVGVVALLGLVMAQTGWLLRPFVLRPSAPAALFRPVEGDFVLAMTANGINAAGFDMEWAPQVEGLARRVRQ